MHDDIGGSGREARSVDGCWETDRVRRLMNRETASRSGITIGVALWRLAYPAIQREMCRNFDVRPTLDERYMTQPSIATTASTIADVRAQLAGHGRYMEEVIYGLSLD